MKEALIALGGAFVGLLVSEHFRRSARVEAYSRAVFDKRLAVYEALYKKVNVLNDLAATLVNDSARPLGERQASWATALNDVFDFIADSELYLSIEIIVHASATLACVDQILNSAEPSTQELYAKEYERNLQRLREMIRSDSGAQASESLLQRIFGARHRSKYLDVYRKNKLRVHSD